MILIVLSWLCCLIMSYIVGSLIQVGWVRCHREPLTWSPVLTAIAGLAILSAIAAALSLVLPVDLSLQILLVMLVGLGVAILKPPLLVPLQNAWQEFQGLPPIYRILGVAIAFYLGWLLCFRPAVALFGYDTGYYHAPSIQWIERFPAIAGLGNFFGPLANNSIWFITLALFDLAPRSDTPTHGIGFLLLGLGMWTAITRSIPQLRFSTKFSSVFWLASLLPLIWLYSFYATYSTSTDLPVSVLVIVIFGYFLEYVESEEQYSTQITLLLAILIPFAIAIKLSTAPLLLLLVWVGYRETRKQGWWFLGIIAGILGLVLTPQILRNMVLSGYLIYPFPSIDMLFVDWKVPLVQAIREKHDIEGWSRFPTIEPQKVLDAGWDFWFPTWFNGLPNNPDVRFIGFKNTLEGRSLGASILIFLASLIVWRPTFRILRAAAIAYITGMIGLIFWFVSAPDLRFAYGFLWVTTILLCLPVLVQVCQLTMGRWILVLFVSIIVVIAPIDRTLYWYSLFARFDWTWQPMPYPDPVNRPWVVDGQTFFVPTEENRCWHLFPCTPNPSPKLQLRGSSISNGFRQL